MSKTVATLMLRELGRCGFLGPEISETLEMGIRALQREAQEERDKAHEQDR